MNRRMSWGASGGRIASGFLPHGGSLRRTMSWPFLVVLLAAAVVAPVAADTPPPTDSTPAAPQPIQPDRPGIADGSTVVGAGVFQIETGVLEQWRRDGPVEEHDIFTPTLFRYGIGKRL